MNNSKLYLKIAGILLFSLFVINTFANDVFIAGTPKIRPDAQAVLAGRFGLLVQSPRDFIATLFPPAPKDLKDVPLQPIGTGVYAHEKEHTKEVIFKDNEINWIEYTYIVNGQEIKIRVPEGQPAPPQKVVERNY
jgi:hypothetical protein